MVRLSSSSRSWPIGVHLDGHLVRLAQWQRGDAPRVVCVQGRLDGASEPGTSEYIDQAVRTIRRLCAEGEFDGRSAVTLSPANRTSYLSMQIARMPADELRSAVAIRMSTELDVPHDELQSDFITTTETPFEDMGKIDLMGVGCPVHLLD
jgi:Tfp pilus assembly PilM family ATPase